MASPRNPGYNNITSVTVTVGTQTRTHQIRQSLLAKTHTVTSGYHYKVAHGYKLPELTYSMRKLVDDSSWWKYSNVLAGFDNGSFTGSNSFVTGCGIPIYTDPTSSANSKALQKFFSNADSKQSNVGVTMAELPRTVALIGDTATRLYNMYKRLKRFDVRGAFAAIGYHHPKLEKKITRRSRSLPRTLPGRDEFASSAVLELQYGWKPLLSEVHNALVDVAERFLKDDRDIMIRGGGSSNGEWQTSPRSNPSTLGTTIVRSNSVNKCRVGYLCFAQIIKADRRTAAGIGSQNPLEIAWELLPFSFVADWFMPIGAWVDSLGALEGLSFIQGSKSVLRRVEYTERLVGVRASSPAVRFKNEERTRKDVTFTRTVLTGFPSGFGMLNLKGLDQVFGTAHTVNAIALLHQIMKGRKADRY